MYIDPITNIFVGNPETLCPGGCWYQLRMFNVGRGNSDL